MSITKSVPLNSYSSMKFILERFRYFLTLKINFESQNFAIFDIFYSTDRKIKKLFDGFGPKGRSDKMCVESEVILIDIEAGLSKVECSHSGLTRCSGSTFIPKSVSCPGRRTL